MFRAWGLALVLVLLSCAHDMMHALRLQTGLVYAVEFSHRSGRDLINMAKTRTNIIPIIEDARHPLKYRMVVGMVDTIFADVAQPDQVCLLTRERRRVALRLRSVGLLTRSVCVQARIVSMNAHYFLKTGGHFVISIKANCIDSTAPPAAVFAKEVRTLCTFCLRILVC